MLAVYGNTASHWNVYDCTLCIANIIMAGQAKGIGSCWIGFAESFMDRPEIKERYKVPADYHIVGVLSLGYAHGKGAGEAKREAPVIFNRA